MRINELIDYQPNRLFLEKLKELRKANFLMPWDYNNHRHLDPFVMSLTGSTLAGNCLTSVVASAATIIIVAGITRITGNTQVTLVKLPTGFRGVFCNYNTDAAPHTTATGGTYAASDGTYEAVPFALASTVVRYKMLLVLSDGTYLYPSY